MLKDFSLITRGDNVLRIITVSIYIALIIGLVGCGKSTGQNYKSQKFIIDETETTISYFDKFGSETVVTKNPQRVVIAFNSILGLWYYAGGESLTKVKGKVNVPKEAKDLIDLGSNRSLSLEKIAALEPELVILAANIDSQVAMAPILKEMGIEVMIIDTSVNSYKRFKENAYLFSKINGREDLYEGKITALNSDIDKLVKRTTALKSRPKVAVILTTSKNMSLETDIALTGEMVNLLGGENIYKEKDVLVSGKTRVTFSIESIITQNPEIIMFSTMGSVDGCKKTIDNMIKENPVWHEVEAVKNNRVYFLPKKYSVYKPNELYYEAFSYIAQIMYPEAFKEM